MAEPFLGEIRLLATNFAPVGWATCDGQLLAITTNSALFALIGTFYGGNGTSTFALPDLRGRVPIHVGQGNGLSPYNVGQFGGVENVTLLQNQIPAHTHTLQAATVKATAQVPANNSWLAHSDDTSGKGSTPAVYLPAGTTPNLVNLAGVGSVGGSQPHPNIQPYLAVTFCIALQGIFPSRN